jgi:hypothetical protein
VSRTLELREAKDSLQRRLYLHSALENMLKTQKEKCHPRCWAWAPVRRQEARPGRRAAASKNCGCVCATYGSAIAHWTHFALSELLVSIWLAWVLGALPGTPLVLRRPKVDMALRSRFWTQVMIDQRFSCPRRTLTNFFPGCSDGPSAANETK